MKELTLYDIMGEDHYVLANLESDKWVTVKVLNEYDEEVYHVKSHLAAWDSLVSFAKMVLDQDKKIQKGLNEVGEALFLKTVTREDFAKMYPPVEKDD